MVRSDTYQAGLACLARREHSKTELARKLRAKGFPPEEILLVLEDLVSQGYLSEGRFVENYIRYRLNSGWGPVNIIQELLQKGVSRHLIDEKMSGFNEGWVSVARQVRQKKFGKAYPEAFDHLVKQKRFLQYRGFTLDQIDQVFEDFESSSSKI